jgi:hypothetical protein
MEKRPASEQKNFSTSEAIISLRDELAHQADANRSQPDRSKKTNWVDVATLLLVVATTGLLVLQDIILHSSDITFKDTLANQKQSNERQLRAYVGITPGDVEDFGTLSKQRIRFIRKNYGITPAYNVGFSEVGINVVRIGQPINTGPPGQLACNAPKVAEQFTIFPTMELPWTIVIGTKVSDDDATLIKAGERLLVYWGNICYHDAFGLAHYTNYCWSYKGNSMTARDAEGCLTHNDSN